MISRDDRDPREVTGEDQKRARELFGLAGFLLACFFVEGLAAFLTSLSVKDWYPSLAKPSWTPPGWLFGPVWTALYISMGISAWILWKRGGWAGARTPLVMFFLQLLLNAAWSGLFFGLRSPGLAFFEIALLWCAIALTAAFSIKVSRTAALLLFPYLAWVSYAAALNLAIWRSNP